MNTATGGGMDVVAQASRAESLQSHHRLRPSMTVQSMLGDLVESARKGSGSAKSEIPDIASSASSALDKDTLTKMGVVKACHGGARECTCMHTKASRSHISCVRV